MEANMEEIKTEGKKKAVRISFDVSPEEAARLCDMRCEPKPSTAAAQLVRLAMREKKGSAK